jgi:glycosyltransferase involved in cell wall biosynthesis
LAVTAHTSDWLEPNLPWADQPRYRRLRLRWRLFFRAVRRRGALVLAVSEFLRGRLIERAGLNAASVHVVGNGVGDEFYTTTAQPPESLRRLAPYVLMIGGLTVYKGGDRLLPLARAMPEAQFVVAGEDDPDIARQAGTLDNVTHLGHQSSNRLPGLLAGAAAVLVLSRYETFGLPAAEAMAAGVPVVACAAGALPEVIGNAGVIVDADRPAEVADVLRGLAADPRGRAALIAKGRVRAEDFRWERVAARVRYALAEEL